MSAPGQTQTSMHPSARSALPLSTDIISLARHVERSWVSASFEYTPCLLDPSGAFSLGPRLRSIPGLGRLNPFCVWHHKTLLARADEVVE